MSQANWSGIVAWLSMIVLYHTLKAIQICKHNDSVCCLLFLLLLLFSLSLFPLPMNLSFDREAVNTSPLSSPLLRPFFSLSLIFSTIERDSLLNRRPICMHSLIRCYWFLPYCLHKSRAVTQTHKSPMASCTCIRLSTAISKRMK